MLYYQPTIYNQFTGNFWTHFYIDFKIRNVCINMTLRSVRVNVVVVEEHYIFCVCVCL
jgi:hypothetical protein